MHYFHWVTLLYLPLTLTFNKDKIYNDMVPFHPLRRILAKFRFTAVFSPDSATDEAKRGEFSLWSDLDLSCDVLFLLYSLKAFDCRLAASLQPLARKLGSPQNAPPPAGRRITSPWLPRHVARTTNNPHLSVLYESSARHSCPTRSEIASVFADQSLAVE